MNTLFRKIVLFDKTSSVIIVAIVLAVVFNVMGFIYSNDLKKSNDTLRPEISDMQALANEAMQIKRTVQSKEKQALLRRSSGVVSTLEQILKVLDMKAKVIKPLDKKKVEGFIEENAELVIDDTDLNHIVNLLYKLKVSPSPIKIKSASLKTTFEDPDKFILRLSLSLMSKG